MNCICGSAISDPDDHGRQCLMNQLEDAMSELSEALDRVSELEEELAALRSDECKGDAQ